MSTTNVTGDPDSRGAFGVTLFVFCVLGLLVTLGGQSLLARLAGQTDVESLVVEHSNHKKLVQPSPALKPAEVVTLQLQGLAKEPDSGGIEQCFALASPGNKESTGPLERFAAMLHRAPYDVLLFHHLALIGQPTVDGDSAKVIVTLLDAKDQIYIFQFFLSKQHGEGYVNCWMTDAVFPIRQIPVSEPNEIPTAKSQQNRRMGLTKFCSPPSVVGPQVWGGVDG